MTTTGKTTTTLTAQQTLDAWKDALRNSLALVEAYKPDEYDTKSEERGQMPWGLTDLASRIGYELYMRKSWTLPLFHQVTDSEDGSLFDLIGLLIRGDDDFAQLEHDYGQASTQGPRLSRKADYSKEFGWNHDEMNRQMASSDSQRGQDWKDEQGIIDIDGEPTFYAF
jgi:hypothetical protein